MYQVSEAEAVKLAHGLRDIDHVDQLELCRLESLGILRTEDQVAAVNSSEAVQQHATGPSTAAASGNKLQQCTSTAKFTFRASAGNQELSPTAASSKEPQQCPGMMQHELTVAAGSQAPQGTGGLDHSEASQQERQALPDGLAMMPHQEANSSCGQEVLSSDQAQQATSRPEAVNRTAAQQIASKPVRSSDRRSKRVPYQAPCTKGLEEAGLSQEKIDICTAAAAYIDRHPEEGPAMMRRFNAIEIKDAELTPKFIASRFTCLEQIVAEVRKVLEAMPLS